MIKRRPNQSNSGDWPDLPLAAWADSCATLHLWTQVVGKIRLAHAPMVNHWWQVPLYLTSRGRTTSPIPYGAKSFQIDFDFIDHKFEIRTSHGAIEAFALGPRSVADFYGEVMGRLRGLGLETRIWTMPVEIEGAIPFDQDREHASYDPEYVGRFWRILVQVDRLFTLFRSQFLGKVSPVHFFWGSFDLAVTRFSGRTAPLLTSDSPNLGRWVMQEAYSHEVSSCGFWPGNGGFGRPAFFSYAYPEPAGFADPPVSPPPQALGAGGAAVGVPVDRHRALDLQDVARGEVDEDQAGARIAQKVAQRVVEAVAAEVGDGERVAVHADEARAAAAMRHIEPALGAHLGSRPAGDEERVRRSDQRLSSLIESAHIPQPPLTRRPRP